MILIRRRLVETSETAEEKIEYIKSTLQKNIVISAIVGSVVILLLLLFCYIRFKNGRFVEAMSRKQLEKRKPEFKRVLELEEIEERENAAILRQQERKRNASRQYEHHGDETMKINSKYDAEAGEVRITESNEEGDCVGIEVSPLHSTLGKKNESLQSSNGPNDAQCKALIETQESIKK